MLAIKKGAEQAPFFYADFRYPTLNLSNTEGSFISRESP